MTNGAVGAFRYSFFVLCACLVLGACAGTRDPDFLERINAVSFGGGRLCSAPLRLPGRLDETSVEYPFERLMLREGILQITQAGSRPIVDVVPAFRKTTRPARWSPGYRGVCFGRIRATAIEHVDRSNPAFPIVTFHYARELNPWGLPLEPYLHIKSTGKASVQLDAKTMMPIRGPDINFLYAYFPLSGRNWYPLGIPRFVPHKISV